MTDTKKPTTSTVATRRVMARLYAEDELVLGELCARLGLGEGEVVRLALRALAKRERVR